MSDQDHPALERLSKHDDRPSFEDLSRPSYRTFHCLSCFGAICISLEERDLLVLIHSKRRGDQDTSWFVACPLHSRVTFGPQVLGLVDVVALNMILITLGIIRLPLASNPGCCVIDVRGSTNGSLQLAVHEHF